MAGACRWTRPWREARRAAPTRTLTATVAVAVLYRTVDMLCNTRPRGGCHCADLSLARGPRRVLQARGARPERRAPARHPLRQGGGGDRLRGRVVQGVGKERRHPRRPPRRLRG